MITSPWFEVPMIFSPECEIFDFSRLKEGLSHPWAMTEAIFEKPICTAAQARSKYWLEFFRKSRMVFVLYFLFSSSSLDSIAL